jgi:hypothetical protein
MDLELGSPPMGQNANFCKDEEHMKYTSAIAKAIIILLLGMICAGCEKSVFSILMRPTPLPIINPDNLNFKDTETKQHFESLSRCIINFVDVRWKAIPYHVYGNFCQAS